jgi:anti-anti-sigma factor
MVLRLIRLAGRIGALTMADAGHLRVRAGGSGGVCVLWVSGELDALSADGFAKQARGLIDRRAERLVLDLSGLLYADCAGVRALAAMTGLVPGDCPVIVRSARPIVRRVLELTGVALESRRDRAVTGVRTS